MLFASRTSRSSTRFRAPDAIPIITDTCTWNPVVHHAPSPEFLLILRRQVPELMDVEVRRDVAIQVAPASAVRDVPELVACPAIDLLERGRLKEVATHCPERNARVINVAVRVNPGKQGGVTVEVLELQDVLQLLKGAIDAQPFLPFRFQDVVRQP